MIWEELKLKIKGELSVSLTSKLAYSTDASIYRKPPLGVVYPANTSDLQEIVKFAQANKINLIPRAAGTSLAGQCVGDGLVIDVSKHFTSIIGINIDEEWVEVEPGVIRDELNRFLKPYGFFFGPNTSTASRCMMGGMLGNNSSGTTSIKYGVTRDKVLSVEAILHDGSLVKFQELTPEEIEEKIKGGGTEGHIYKQLVELLSPKSVQEEIVEKFPSSKIHRRNTGYALDELIKMSPFRENGEKLNICKLLAGSEGTLCITSKMRLKIDRLPPVNEAVVCAHFLSVHEAMKATVVAMTFAPFACELMDRTILDLTQGNSEQAENRFFVEGDPGAILAIELRSETTVGLDAEIKKLITALSQANLGFAYPIVRPPKTEMVWNLRAAGLGVLSNMPGAAKPIAFVEDTAVDLEHLPAYIADFENLMESFGQKAVYYAHAGAGELHLRPVLNLKIKAGRQDLRSIAETSAKLVKKYNGSLSGEHGDGRVRAEFIELMVGAKNYELFKQVKTIWDPQNLFNPGKIVFPDPMDSDLRYQEDQKPFCSPTFLNFGESENMLEAAERCNGSGDCRKPASSGASMCPSYQASLNELDSTRARANVLREVLTNPASINFPLDSKEVKEVLDLCLSCKVCKRECPSSVDMAALKAEAMYQYQLRNGFSRRTKFFGNFHKSARLASSMSVLTNPILKLKSIDGLIKKFYSIAKGRSIPQFSLKRASALIENYNSSEIPDFVFYLDEFTEFQDAEIALSAAKLFHGLGFKFHVVYSASGRAAISKSMLPLARQCAQDAINKLELYVQKSIPIVGLEPSGILGFRDDYLKLVEPDYQEKSKSLAQSALTFEEFLYRHTESGRIHAGHFTDKAENVHIHLHCHQKALSHIKYSKAILNLPKNYKVQAIPSGCCGMAGSFGYEKEHFEMSNKIGELVLFPHIRKNPNAIIAAAGTSCRHQVKDGVGAVALHPAEILLKALNI